MARHLSARVAIVGAGYAGMAAAVELAAAGVAVEVFEASKSLGGRARATEIEGLRVDNGAHILVGAYRETLRLMKLAGAPASALARSPLRLAYPGEFSLTAPRLPAPLHLAWALLTAKGLDWRDKLAAITFMDRQKRQGFRLAQDTSAAALLAGQTAPVRRYLWDPLCLAALNTPVAEASAQVFLNVLRDSLAGARAASDLMLPAADFSALFPEPAAAFVAARGGRVHRGRRIDGLGRSAEGFRLDGFGSFDQVVLAVAPYHLGGLVSALPALAPLATQAAAFAWQPIVTAYLHYPPTVRLPGPMVGVADGMAQWLFDFGALRGHAGLIAAVISGHGTHEALDRDALAARIHGEIGRVVPGLPAPRWQRLIVEKRATFACTPALRRPATATAEPGLWLAGDYVAGDYPATLEGAVRSGVRAARSVLQATASQA